MRRELAFTLAMVAIALCGLAFLFFSINGCRAANYPPEPPIIETVADAGVG